MKRFLALTVAVLSVNSAFAQNKSVDMNVMPTADELIERQSEISLQNKMNSMIWGDDAGWADSCRFGIRVPDRVTRGTIALTFDDGPNPATTPLVLETLKKHGAKATFFMLGGKIAGNEALVKRILAEGHNIGSHSWNHPNFHTLSVIDQKNQIYQTDKVLRQFETPKYFRYPYGNSTCVANDYLKSLNYHIVGWNIDTCDWAFASTGYVSDKSNQTCQAPQSLRGNYAGYVAYVVGQTNGGVLLMHDIHGNTAKSLDRLMTSLEQSGYRFVSISDKNLYPNLNAN